MVRAAAVVYVCRWPGVVGSIYLIAIVGRRMKRNKRNHRSTLPTPIPPADESETAREIGDVYFMLTWHQRPQHTITFPTPPHTHQRNNTPPHHPAFHPFLLCSPNTSSLNCVRPATRSHAPSPPNPSPSSAPLSLSLPLSSQSELPPFLPPTCGDGAAESTRSRLGRADIGGGGGMGIGVGRAGVCVGAGVLDVRFTGTGGLGFAGAGAGGAGAMIGCARGGTTG